MRWFGLMIVFTFLTACSISQPWNSPYTDQTGQGQVLYSSFSSPPKHLDPVVSYNANEWAFLSQVYEPPLQYHYLKRPYSLEPLTLTAMPEIQYLDIQGKTVDENSNNIAFSEYVFKLNPAIRYQPHPAFAKDEQGGFYYQDKSLTDYKTLLDFKQQDSRPLLAHDYIYAIKRMADAKNHSPILDTMKQYIVGLEIFSNNLSQLNEKKRKYDLRDFDISGVKVIDNHSFSIKIKGIYPQFLYWLSMNFFAPIPWEAEQFYQHPDLVKNNLTLDTYPVGTGPYMLVENNPNKRMRLLKNPNYQHGFYPTDGLSEGANTTLLNDAGKALPFIDEVIYSLEKESVPLWNKFLQGFYDASGVSSDSFDQAVSISASGNMQLTDEMQQKGIAFLNTIEPTSYYFAFNMADSLVGGYSEKQQKLRQAISIAINYEEYISIFLNGRGLASQGPIPPGIIGYQEGKQGMNPYIYRWHEKANMPQRKSIEVAKQLLAEAGYKDGLNKEGKRLTLHFDTAATGPDSKSLLNWYRKQFEKLGIELVIRSTDYNRFQDKVRSASVQLFTWGWNADYPDPENFLFLLAGENAVINTSGSGINGANYDNPEFNRLFKQIKTMPNSAQRLKLIQQAVDILRKDAPWAWGFHPKSLALYHSWYHNVWANPLANNTLKYKRIDVQQRAEKRSQWNQPVIWPFIVLLLLITLSIYPLLRAYRQRQSQVIQAKEAK